MKRISVALLVVLLMSTLLTAVAAAEELVVYSTIFAGYAERMVQEFELGTQALPCMSSILAALKL